MTGTPPYPLTLDGSSILHQMYRFDWSRWRSVEESTRESALNEISVLLDPLERVVVEGHPKQSAVFAQLGHKGDIMFVHHRASVDELARIERDISRTEFGAFLGPQHSYLSIAELGLYESSSKLYTQLASEGIEAYSDEWERRVKETIERQSSAMTSRLYPAIPDAKYLCFYPMDKRRGEHANWYTTSMEDRVRMMQDHGKIGRRFAGAVKQIISGSIGLDNWEWGVDLYSDNPGVFKQLIYEMRFDEASAVYGLFGEFYVGVRLRVADMSEWFAL